jgi:hypothetical protein
MGAKRLSLVIGLVVLGIAYAIVADREAAAWRSNLALWERAIQEAENLPRPALNHGLALLKDGQHEAGIAELVRAAQLAAKGPRGDEVRQIVRHELRWLEAFGVPACSRPDARPYC